MVQGENPVSDAGVLALGRALEVNKTLQYLNLVSCRVVLFVALFSGMHQAYIYFGLFLSHSYVCFYFDIAHISNVTESRRF